MTPMDIILDCDPGIDDALALALAVATPELNLCAVTCVAGNRPVETTARNARALLDLFGAPDIPVYAGAPGPLDNATAQFNLVHGEDGLGGVDIDRSGIVADGHGADVLAEALLSEARAKLTVVATGPLTNLALAETRHPGILARARAVLVMGGAMYCPGNVTAAAEFNFYADAGAAGIVARSGAALQIFPLDVTRDAAMTPDWLRRLASQETRSMQALTAMLRAYGAQDPLLHDVCPVAALIAPTLFSGETGCLKIESGSPCIEGRCWFHPGRSSTKVYFETQQEHLLEVIAERLMALP